jgi:hypothetical protein
VVLAHLLVSALRHVEACLSEENIFLLLDQCLMRDQLRIADVSLKQKLVLIISNVLNTVLRKNKALHPLYADRVSYA